MRIRPSLCNARRGPASHQEEEWTLHLRMGGELYLTASTLTREKWSPGEIFSRTSRKRRFAGVNEPPSSRPKSPSDERIESAQRLGQDPERFGSSVSNAPGLTPHL